MNTKGTEALQFIQVFFTVFRFIKLMFFIKKQDWIGEGEERTCRQH